MDELARVSAELETIESLIFLFRRRPSAIKKLAPVRQRLLDEQRRLQAMRAILAEDI
jgi:hypothetical protein